MGLSSILEGSGDQGQELVLRQAGHAFDLLRIMLRITSDTNRQPPVLKLEGNLGGPWVMEVEEAWDRLTKGEGEDRAIVDLAGVTFVDSAGKRLLARMFQGGAEFQSAHGLTKYIVERIQQESGRSRK